MGRREAQAAPLIDIALCSAPLEPEAEEIGRRGGTPHGGDRDKDGEVARMPERVEEPLKAPRNSKEPAAMSDCKEDEEHPNEGERDERRVEGFVHFELRLLCRRPVRRVLKLLRDLRKRVEDPSQEARGDGEGEERCL